MLNFVTVNHKNYCGRGVEYTNHLLDMVRRNLEAGIEGRFIVFTDDPNAGYARGIETRPLPSNLGGWFTKLALFAPDALPTGDRVIYMDLDTLITGSIDALTQYRGTFGILQDFYRPTGLQSSVMLWEAGSPETLAIWEAYDRAGCPQDDAGGDQAFIEKCQVKGRERLQIAFPDMFASYKVSGGRLPDKASVVVFHGHPRPHEVTTGWVPKVWCEGGISHSDLKAVCNTAQEKLLENVRKACRRNVPWFEPADEHDKHVAILGGGPSLVDKIEEIQWRQSIGQDVWVLNNAHVALAGTGIKFDRQVLLDAQPAMAKMITDANGYFVASQCDPGVFGALYGRCVTLFHVNSPGMEFLGQEKERLAYLVGGGTTVGMNALALAFLLGYRKIHLYGFDSCYRDGAHHAYAQPLNDAEHATEAVYGDKTYLCAPWMVGQAREFLELVPSYMDDGAIITVHGSGLIPDIGLELLGYRSPAQQRADQVLARVPQDAAGVEVGVFAGQMSAALLRGGSGHLWMVDSWEAGGAGYWGDSGDWHAGLNEASQDEFMRQAYKRVAFAGKRATILRMRSTDAAPLLHDTSLDYVFIDADHSHLGCAADIAAWRSKVKPGGWLCGHDYENVDFPKFGVTQAVNEFVAKEGLELQIGANFCWFVRIPSQA